ncbi:hypothetical protein KP509_38G046900 [Ceratopteris richardii]|uniref:Uncharacterized protein n=1 Tax=Ceratopteris richardii TaxID=49495 RepID=A0A8T2Q4J7_CERRI|nr:hypothetical protein KP509_38G046900 [Ceratopteris richardii]
MIQYREAVNPEVEHQVKRTSVVKSMNFLEDNRSFVLMSDYAKSHNEERGDGEVEWPVKRSEPFSVESNDEEMFVDAKSCVEVIHCPGGPIENGCQMKEDISPHNTGACSEQEVLKPIPLFSKCTGTCFEERNLDSLGSSTQDSYQSSDTNRENTRKTYSGCDIDDSLEETLIASTTILTDRISSHLDYIVDDVSSVCDNPDGLVQSNTHLGQAVSNFVCQSHQSGPSDFQKDFLKFYERHVKAQEQRNQFQFVKLQHLLKQQTLEEEKIQLASAANGLMRENIDLNRHKVSFKENIALEQQAKAAHVSFCSMCADELAAGLCIMLTTLVYSVRMYSFSLLNDLVSMCQSSIKEPRRSIGFHMDWFYNSLDSLAGKLQAIVCHFTVTGRILIGSILVGVVAQSLIRRSIMNSSQAMPATILIVVLGGICGFVGKISIDSLGGSGITWWLIWGTFCFLHALTNCFTPSIYRFLHGSHTGRKSRFGLPFWMRRLAFHSLIVLFLPLLAGLLPFGNFSHVTYDLFSTLIESASYASTSFLQWSLLSFWKQ